jgi:hypothetical protein
VMGYARLGSKVEEAIGLGIQVALRNGSVIEQEGRIAVSG